VIENSPQNVAPHFNLARRCKIEPQDSSIDRELIERLRKIEGQVRGLQRMIEEQRDCSEIIVQVLATRSALEQVGIQLLDRQLHNCFPDDLAGLEPLKRSLRLWFRLGAGS